MRRTLPVLLAAFASALACDDGDPGSTWIVIEAQPGADIELASARLEPHSQIEKSVVDGRRLLAAVRAGTAVRVEAKGACPVHIDARDVTAGRTLRRTLKPWFDIQGATQRAGFGGSVKLTVNAGCKEAERGHVDWTQTSGPALRNVIVSENGRHWSAMLPDLESVLGSSPAWGIVPLSPRTRAAVELEAVWQGENASETRKVTIAASPPLSGVPNVPLGARLVLGGEGWKLLGRPRNSNSALTAGTVRAELAVDAPGDYRLQDASGTELEIRADRYDATPLDCGRGGCHGDVVRAFLDNPMASTLARALEGNTPRPACGIACHSVAGAGDQDGGFLHVAGELGFDVTAIDDASWDTLPRDLRRLGGVGCLACHGPGAVPAPSARWAILRSDVCATCHDAPPRYGHVAAWRSSAMARADEDSRTRSDPNCARCHTTQGFLHSQGALAEARPAPAAVGALGIGCAACHAVHSPEKASAHLVRRVRSGGVLGERVSGASALCAACHAPDHAGAVGSSSAVLWAARGGLDPTTGEPLEGAAVHGNLSCIDCHRAGPSELARGAMHAFRADNTACKRCHTRPNDVSEAQRALEARARELWARIARSASLPQLASSDAEPHASLPALNVSTVLGRAAFDVLMVLEDRAAAVHGLPYARALLDAAERSVAARGATP